MISVLILTKNEEQDLPGCLASVDWCDDVHVFDSFSTDRTVEIALASGATVTQRHFDGYATQRNFALSSIKYNYNWLFILDADERVPLEMARILREKIINVSSEINAFRIARRDILGTTWLKHAQISPFYIRLIRLGKATYSREINEVINVIGDVQNLDGYINHYPFSKGITHWLTKHNQYSSMEAKRWVDEYNDKIPFSIHQALFNNNFNERRFHQKGLFYKLPGRPIIKWLYMVFGRLAFLDGNEGLTYAALQTIYEYFIVLKSEEILNKKHYRSDNFD